MRLFGRRSKDLFVIDDVPMATGELRMVVVQDVFTITGRGVVVTGRIESGTVAIGSPVTVERAGQPIFTTTVSGIEQFRKLRDRATAGDQVGLLLRGVRQDVVQGDVLRGG